jgi:ADP-ribose pyrophosphatase YjhB (NUDIX family)
MSRTLACLAVLLAAVPPLAAQTRQPGDPVPLTLTPARLPEPSLQYRLLPGPQELTSGNAASLTYRTEALLVENPSLLREIRSVKWIEWMALPHKDLPREEVHDRLRTVALLLRELDRAAHCRDCDWQLAGRPEGIALLLPEIQGLRELANVLAVRVRYEAAEGQFPEALQALQTGYALARHLSQAPSLIHVLVGGAIASIMDRQLEEMLEQPGAPNLYWALAVLPHPFLDPELAIQEDEPMIERSLPFAKRLEEGPMTAAEVEGAERQLRQLNGRFGTGPTHIGQEIVQAWHYGAAYAEAKRALVKEGMPGDQVTAMPVFQAAALYTLREYRRAWEEYTKWFAVPGGWHEPGYQQSRKRYQEAALRLDRLFFPENLGGGIPRLEKIGLVLDRIERRFAALRCVEAIQLYAATHDGKLPAALADITDVPVPPDPVTGKPFAYTVQGDKAKLDSPAPSGEELPYQKVRYEITLRR